MNYEIHEFEDGTFRVAQIIYTNPGASTVYWCQIFGSLEIAHGALKDYIMPDTIKKRHRLFQGSVNLVPEEWG